jgi:superfamily II DNA/RNA helicase
MGFLPEVRRFLDMVKPDRQTLLFSATLDGDVDVLIRNYQRDPVRCEVAATEEEDDRTTHLFLDAKRDQRASMTAELVSRHDSAIVFCRTKHGADRLAEQLARNGVSTVAIHGNRSQAQRDRALAAFAARRVQALVATDVAARGIHVDQVGVVVHFDPPADAKDYVHRSGRTGRAGAVGTVVSFVTEGDGGTTRKLQKTLGLEVTASAGPPPRSKKAFPKAAPVSRPSRGGGRPSPKPAGSVRKAHARPPRGRFR